MRTREVAEICGVSIPTVTENAKMVGIELGDRWNPHEFTEDEIKKLQVQLMKNQARQGIQTETVKTAQLNRFNCGLSLQVIMDSGNLEAAKDLCKVIMDGAQAKHDLMIEQQKSKELQAIVDKYVQWMTKSEIKAKYHLPQRPGVDKVALVLGLEEGKDWVKRFYDDRTIYWKILYSPEAVERIVEYITDLNSTN